MVNRMSLQRPLLSLVVAALVTSCEASDPVPTAIVDAGVADAGSTCSTAVTTVPAQGVCPRPVDDYRPGMPGTAGWPSCVSDQGVYVPVEASISALARIAAFEEIRAVLGFETTKIPSSDDFVQARVLYSQDQGIESRIARREDEHYPAASKLCRDMSEAELAANRDRCVGPAVLRPILNDAFAKGIAGDAPTVQAARIEAALLAWLYFSIFKEATSAKDASKDTDSMWAKYTGGKARAATPRVSLARYVATLAPETHERIEDGLLAVRCWRDSDNPTGVASNTALQLRARTQLDRALLHGLAAIVRQRAAASERCSNAWEAVTLLGGFLVREATARDAAQGALLAAALAKPSATGASEVNAVLERVFPCP
jgi:hypothetical protein